MTSAAAEVPSFEPVGAYDQELLAAVSPRAWVSPVPAKKYDLVVIGAGPAGLVTAAAAAGLGAKTALVEKGLMGGDCLNFGCVPSKALLRAAYVASAVKGFPGLGVAASVSVDGPAVLERIRKIRSRLAQHDSAQRFTGLGVDVFLGSGRFVSRDEVGVDDRRLRFRRACIATGSRARVPDIPGLSEVGPLTNETVFSLLDLPKRLLILGGGPIGCELAQAFARLGTRVTLIESQDRLLPRDDADAAVLLQQALQADGVQVQLSARVVEARRTVQGKVLVTESGPSRSEWVGDEILLAVGRIPRVEGLGLDAAGVGSDGSQGIAVDRKLRTSNRRVFAAGDVCSRYQFTHAADAAARVVVQNALFFPTASVPTVIPWCTYTDPEVAQVGWTEQEASAKSEAVSVRRVALEELDRPRLDGRESGFVKVILRKRSDRILGATVVGPHAGDLVGEWASAMTLGLGLRALGRTVRPYPTYGEAVRRLSDMANRDRLTPLARRLLRGVRWLRSIGT